MAIIETIDLITKERQIITKLLATYLPNTEVWAYGSRVKWLTKPSSDLDLVAFVKPEQAKAIGNLKEAFEESELPFTVDLHIWQGLPEYFHENIKNCYAIVQKLESKTLPKGWREVRLGDVVNTNLFSYSSKDNWKFINYLDTSSITENKIESYQLLEIDKDNIPSRAKRKVNNQDVIFSNVRPNQRHYGLLKNIPENTLVSTGFTVINAKKSAYSPFIYWYLTQENIISYLQGIGENSASTYPAIKSSDIEALNIDLPPLPEQKAIANILGSLDDKIELNRQMNTTLEQMAQALFKSWFVNFDPVIDNALKANNPIPTPFKQRAKNRQNSQSKPPLPKAIQSLFPNEFELHDKMGWIPKGWEVKTIEDMAQVVGGGTPSTKEKLYFCENGISWLSPKDLSGYQWKYISKGATDITELGLKNSSAKLMPKNSILFSSRAPIGYIAISENEICTNQGFKSLIPNKSYFTEYLYNTLKTNTEELKSIATGSTFTEISGNILKNFKVLTPSKEVLKLLESKTKEINYKLISCKQQNQTLTQLQDTLLPKLISGKIRVTNYE